MDIAQCTLDGVVYLAVRFKDLPLAEFARKKRHLVCPECRATAFFRKASSSGQSACFCARPHEEGCTLAASKYEQNDNGPGDDQDILNNPGQRIVLDINFGAHNDKHNDPDANTPNPGGRGGHFIGGGARPDAVMHRRLSRLLRNLIDTPEFRTSQQILEVAGVGEFSVANFFVPFDAVSQEYEKRYRGYWGRITIARFWENVRLCLNTGDRGSMSIWVPMRFVNELYERFHVSDEKGLSGRYALVLGTLKVSSPTGKKYVEVGDTGYITLR